jgi:phospholipase C
MQMPRIWFRYQRDLQPQAWFRSISRLKEDFENGDVAQVVFIEPLYQDDPRRGHAQATDDHPPASLWGGQRFLRRVYDAITVNQSVWEHLVAVVTYDEHGSFFDHVQPPRLRTDPPPNARYSDGFDTLGLRVPAIVVSPFVRSASVSEGILDHTSILRFFGEKFGDGRYTPLVDSRPVGSISDVLDVDLLALTKSASAPPSLS